MANKIIGIVLILCGLALGALFYEQVFRHGWTEGLVKLEQFRMQDWIWGIGAVFAFFVGLGAVARKKKQGRAER